MAVGPCVDLFHCGNRTVPELILTVEDHDLPYTVKCCLDLNGSSGTACTYDSHFFADGINVVIFKSCHEPDTVCDMSGKVAVVIDDGIYGTAHLSSRGKLVKIFSNQGLVWHGNIGTSHFKGTDGFYSILDLICANLKSKVCIVITKLCKSLVLHGR